jgi:hypothetical protein
MDTGILFSIIQQVGWLGEWNNSRTGQRALAETTTTRELSEEYLHRESNSVFPTYIAFNFLSRVAA